MMLGIFLIICLIVYVTIDLKAYYILKDNSTEPVVLGSEAKTYELCNPACKLNVISLIVMLIGYLVCMFPYLFFEGIETKAHIAYIVMFGVSPILIISYLCYFNIKNSYGHISISENTIEHKRGKSFTVQVDDIKSIACPAYNYYQIGFKKSVKKRPLNINIRGFNKNKEIHSLMKQLRDSIEKASGRDKGIGHNLKKFHWMLGKCGAAYIAFIKISLLLALLYTSYCCIDYDFFRKDYTAQYNALNVDLSQSENAWRHYVQASANYVEMEDDLQDIMDDGICSGEFELTGNQKNKLKEWFDDNASSWESLRKATSIDYCNATYENTSVSLLEHTDRNDFSSPSDDGYSQIKHLYHNTNMVRLAGVIDIDWFDLFQMQLISSNHFINGKSILDQVVGYATLSRSVKLLSNQESYESESLENARRILDEYFPVGIPPLDLEGEIFMSCSTIEDMINRVNIPTQTPLNPMFLAFGSVSGTEKHIRNQYTNVLEKAQNGIAVEPDYFSMKSFLILRNMLFSVLDPTITKVYRIYQRADTYLLASYFILDLEEYQLIKGYYPENIQQLSDAGLTSELPDDPDTDGKINYSNDGQRAVLYAVGKNGKDDGGYKDLKKSDGERDDIIFWERELVEVSETEKH